jgi:hypothetical protein
MMLVGGLLALSSCTVATSRRRQPPALGDDFLTVGSFDCPERGLLAEIYGQAIGHRVDVTLRPPENCVVRDEDEVPSKEPGVRPFEPIVEMPPDLRGHAHLPVGRRLRNLRLRVRG